LLAGYPKYTKGERMNDVSKLIEEATNAKGTQYDSLIVKYPVLKQMLDSCDVFECEQVATLFLSQKETLQRQIKVLAAGTKVMLNSKSSMYSMKEGQEAVVVSCLSTGACRITFDDGTSLSTTSNYLDAVREA